MDDGIAHQFRPHAEHAAEHVSQGGHLLHDQARVHPGEVPPAPCFRISYAEQVASAGFGKEFCRKGDFIPVHGQDQVPGDGTNQVSSLFDELLLFGGQKMGQHEVLLVWRWVAAETCGV